MWKKLLGVVVIGLGGCSTLNTLIDSGLLTPRSVTLRLVNETEFAVQPSVFVSNLDNFIIEGLTESLLTLGTNAQNFADLPPGEVRTRDFACDDFKAVIDQDATLKTGMGNEPNDSTRILIDGTDFNCGDTVVITYSGGLLNFDARISVQPAGL